MNIHCDVHGYIGKGYSMMYPDTTVMNKHSDEKHDGESFGYSIWKESSTTHTKRCTEKHEYDNCFEIKPSCICEESKVE